MSDSFDALFQHSKDHCRLHNVQRTPARNKLEVAELMGTRQVA